MLPGCTHFTPDIHSAADSLLAAAETKGSLARLRHDHVRGDVGL